ncbi:hypothetical protein C8Q75DRAFT_730936 [Abortiporus biennis]|nr:hypothetical protein C8Q75DRAFT_730936 [Abortiporus biennis]
MSTTHPRRKDNCSVESSSGKTIGAFYHQNTYGSPNQEENTRSYHVPSRDNRTDFGGDDSHSFHRGTDYSASRTSGYKQKMNIGSAGEPERRLRIGDKAPDASGLREVSPPYRSSTSLSSVLPDTSTVLILHTAETSYVMRDLAEWIFDWQSSQVQSAVVLPTQTIWGFRANMVLVDEDGELFKIYRRVVEDDCPAVVIHPDGTIGLLPISRHELKVYIIEGLTGRSRG